MTYQSISFIYLGQPSETKPTVGVLDSDINTTGKVIKQSAIISENVTD